MVEKGEKTRYSFNTRFFKFSLVSSNKNINLFKSPVYVAMLMKLKIRRISILAGAVFFFAGVKGGGVMGWVLGGWGEVHPPFCWGLGGGGGWTS